MLCIRTDYIYLFICTFLLIINFIYLLRLICGVWGINYGCWWKTNVIVWQPGKTFIISFAVTTTSVLELLVADVLWPLNSHSPLHPPPSIFKIKCEWKLNMGMMSLSHVYCCILRIIEIPIFSLKNSNFTFLGILNILILVFRYFKYSNFMFTSLQYILNFLILKIFISI